MNLCGTRELQTERLVLRRFTLADAEAMYHNWASDPEVTKFLLFKTHADVGVSQRILAEWVGSYMRGDFFQWALTLKGSGTPIGSMGVLPPAPTLYQEPKVQAMQVGYCIGQAWWRQGYTSEALTAVISFLFETVGVSRVEARHDPRNPNSGKVMKHCGMHHEGTMRQAGASNAGVSDIAVYGLLAEDYFAARS